MAINLGSADAMLRLSIIYQEELEFMDIRESNRLHLLYQTTINQGGTTQKLWSHFSIKLSPI